MPQIQAVFYTANGTLGLRTRSTAGCIELIGTGNSVSVTCCGLVSLYPVKVDVVMELRLGRFVRPVCLPRSRTRKTTEKMHLSKYNHL